MDGSSASPWLWRYRRGGVEPEAEPEIVWRGRALSTMCVAAGLSALVLAAAQLLNAQWLSLTIHSVVAVVCLLVPLRRRGAKELMLTIHALLGLCLAAMVVVAWFRGGLASPVPMSFAAIPAIASYLFRDRTTILWWGVVAVVMLLGLALVPEILGIELVDQLSTSDRAFEDLAAPVVFIALMVALTRNSMVTESEAIRRAVESERRRLQAEQLSALQRAEQMAMVGQLATGVAHEVNNPLAYLDANIEYATDRLRDEEPERWSDVIEALSDAENGASRIASIVRQLGEHSQVQEESSRPVWLRHVLEDALRLCRHQVASPARIHRRYMANPVVEAEPGRLAQAFFNILVNAVQALPEGDGVDHEIQVVLSVDAHGWAQIQIIDTGQGIDPEVLERVKEPFFSTKAVGSGTGLGLSISDAVARRHGGTLSISSTLGEGTCVLIRLPTTTQKPEVVDEDEGPEPDAPEPERLLRVLIVDDDASVRRGLGRIVPGDAVEVPSVRQALRELERDARFDVVLCDVMMPELSGMDFHRIVAELHPSLLPRLVFVTGCAFGDGELQELVSLRVPLLTKPLHRRELMAAIYELCSVGDAPAANSAGPDPGASEAPAVVS